MPNLPIAEYYTDPQGRFIGYDTEISVSGVVVTSGVINTVLQNQSHIDIRGLIPSGVVTNQSIYSQFVLDTRMQEELDLLTQAELEGMTNTGDNWTAGTVGPSASPGHNYIALVWPLVSGVNTTTSTTLPVDLTNFDPNGYLCLSLPGFPFNRIDNTKSYLTLSGATVQNFYLSDSFVTVGIPPTCAAWPYSSITELHPTTIGLTFISNNTSTVHVTGIRLLSSGWQPLALDMNTQGQFFRPITTQSGSIATTPFPMAWRSDTPPSVYDPRPINSSFGALFYTGSLTSPSELQLFFRGRHEAVITQLDLDYVSTSGVVVPGFPNADHIGFTQGELDALGTQPDFGISLYQPDTQGVLDTKIQSQLDNSPQWALERIYDVTDLAWLTSNLSYTGSNFQINLSNFRTNDTSLYTWSGTGLQANSYYLFNTDLVDTTARISLTSVSNAGLISSGTALFDSGVINDPNFYRSQGRIGWQVSLGDGDAFIKSFVGQSFVFAEYISKPFFSRTPVAGASLNVSATPPLQLFTNAAPYNNAQLAINQAISRSDDGSIQITGKGGQGLITNVFSVTDFNHFEIKFDLYVPQASLNISIPYFAIINAFGLVYQFPIGQILPNSWQTYVVSSATFAHLLPGAFAFVTFASSPTITWYLDNLSISQRVINWSARSTYQDPWNANPIPWTDFGDIINDPSLGDGITLNPPGNALQVRAQALQQNAIIDKFYIAPKYKQLGNLIFDA